MKKLAIVIVCILLTIVARVNSDILLSIPTVFASNNPCNSDINQDRVVDLSDYSILVSNFLKPTISVARADINRDGVVDLSDYSLLVSDFFRNDFTCATSPSPTSTTPINVVNVVSNGGFETGNLNGWEASSGVSVQTQDKRSGNYAARVTAATAPRQLWATVTPGKTYVATAWFKWVAMSEKDWGYSTFSVNNDSFTTLGGVNNLDQIYQQNVWNKIAFTFTPTGTRLGINFGVSGPEPTVDLYFDDIMVYEKTGNLPPTTNPQAAVLSGVAPLAVKFTANADDQDGSIATYQWMFGDGSEERIADPTHTYTSAGVYTATLHAYDNDGAKVSKNITITVTNPQAPVVQISQPVATDTYSTSADKVTLSGSASVPSGQITRLVWDNINSGDAGITPISAGQNLSWSQEVPLKVGKNEILLTVTDGNTRVSTDRIVITRTSSGPSIQNISTNTTSPKVYEKYEATFGVTTVADQFMFMHDPNPPSGVERYSGVTVEGVITLPGGTQVTHPAFYYEETTQSGSSYRLTGNKSWKLRYSPQQTGTHQVSIRVTDKSGTTTSSVGSFNAVAASKPGFIDVSKNDTRYFEYSNGTIHWPIGMTWSGATIPDNSSAPSAINYDRPWMAGRGAWSSNWARWKSSGEGHGNEGHGIHYSYLEHYPSSEISQLIDYPNGWKMWIACFLDEGFCGKIDAGKTYQLKFRVKTKGLTGPKQSGVPYGLVIKNHDWPPDNFETAMRSAQSWIPMISQDKDWHTVVTRFTPTSGGDEISIYMDNVTGGSAFIDELSIREVLSNGSLGAEQIRNPKADWHTYIEQRPMAFFDTEVAQGEANGINLRYVVHDKNDRLINSISSSGVFVNHGGGYYQPENTKATWLQKQWWRYLVARLGYSTAIFGWELNNEGPPDKGDGSHARTTQIFGKWMHDLDAHPHLVNTSFWCCWEPTFWGNKTKFPDVDFGDIHHYGATDDMVQWYLDEAMPVINSNIGRPVVRGETGIMAPGSTNTNDADPALLTANPGVWYHNMLWSQLHYSSMFEIGYWYGEHGSKITGGRTPHARAFANFVKDLDINKGGYQNISATSSQGKFRIFGQRNTSKNKAYGWINHSDHTWKKVMNSGVPSPVSGDVTFTMTPNRSYTVTFYDTYTGANTTTAQVTSNSSGTVTIRVDNVSKDVAFKLN